MECIDEPERVDEKL